KSQIMAWTIVILLALWFRWYVGGRGRARLELGHSLSQRFLDHVGHNKNLGGITPAGIISTAVLSYSLPQDQALGTPIAPGEEYLPMRLLQTRLCRWAGGDVVGIELGRSPQEGGYCCCIDRALRETHTLMG